MFTMTDFLEQVGSLSPYGEQAAALWQAWAYELAELDRREGLPHTAAERETENYEVRFFAAKKYELVRNQPFLYYVFRRRAENADVRILFVCLLAGMKDYEIKARLRSV